MKRFAKGDFAITVNSRAPSVNNGHLVIVREVCGPMLGHGLEFGYLVERVDGEPFAIVCIPGTTMPGRGSRQTYAGQHHLRPLGGPRRGRERRARRAKVIEARATMRKAGVQPQSGRWHTDGRGAGVEDAAMNTSKTPFTSIYVQWLDSLRALIPGGAKAKPPAEATRKQEQVTANQEWEDEGGSLKPAAERRGVKPAPKLPF